jgi:S1-C subfamily serine protease
VTNQHVVSGAETIRVKLHDRSVYDASVIGIDSNTDLAVLKIEATSLVPGEWVEDHEVKVGTMAWAVGSPFGLDQSITSGIISGRHRRVKSSLFPSPADYVFKDLIQTDAAINPGNSGGPLVNANGQIMGINTSIIGLSYQGVCFAVPAKIVKKIADEIILQGFVNRGYLGVYPEMVSYEYAKKNGLADTSGAFVKSIAPKTPASKAGIRPGDVIRKWNQRIVESELTLFNLVANADEDSIVKLVIYRDGSELEKSVKIASRNKELRNGLLKRESSQSLEQQSHD